MNQVTTLLDSFSELTGRFCSWFVALMTLITCVVVVMRYGLDLGSVLLQDVVLYLHGALFLLGSSFALKRDAHVRVDIFYREFSDKRKAFVDLVGHCLFLQPVCWVVFLKIVLKADFELKPESMATARMVRLSFAGSLSFSWTSLTRYSFTKS